MPTPLDRPFRLGLLIDSFTQPRWVYQLLADLRESGLAAISLVALNARARHAGVESWRSHEGGSTLYTLYRRLDDRWFRGDCNPDAFAPTDVRALMTPEVPVLSVVPDVEDGFDDFPADVLNELKRANLDVALCFGFRRLRGDVLRIAREGVWSYHHAEDGPRDTPAGFWEVMHRRLVTGSLLERLTDEPNSGDVLYRSWSGTDSHSVRRSNNNNFWKSSQFVSRVLQQLLDGPVARERATRPQRVDQRPPIPGNLHMARLLAALAWRYWHDKAESLLNRFQWGLGLTFDRRSDGPVFDAAPTDHVVPPADRFWADPFPIEHGGRYFVFVEELLFGHSKAHISVLEVDQQGAVGASAKVLDEPHHLSYPSVFRWRNDVFMTPECSEARRIEMYRAVEFPGRWEKACVLMDGVVAADPTLFLLDDQWWMFVNMAIPGTWNYDECHLYWATRPEGPWSPHPRNPIRSDVRTARPAGRLFLKNGTLYRPSQDCSVRYGYATVINEVHRLSKTEYRETAVARIDPTWREDICATHTLNHAGALTVVDCLFRRSRYGRDRSADGGA